MAGPVDLATLPLPPDSGWETSPASDSRSTPASPSSAPTPPATSTRRWSTLGLTAGATAVVGACAYLVTIDPNTSSAYPPCPLKLLTGLDCAGCGGLRGTHSLLTGDIAGAADHNLLLVLALPLLAYLGLRWAVGRMGHQLPAVRWSPAMTWAVAAVVVVYSVVRNLPWGPGPYLNSAAN